eukprot:7996333-Pyramimonas_sp.AAC.1
MPSSPLRFAPHSEYMPSSPLRFALAPSICLLSTAIGHSLQVYALLLTVIAPLLWGVLGAGLLSRLGLRRLPLGGKAELSAAVE